MVRSRKEIRRVKINKKHVVFEEDEHKTLGTVIARIRHIRQEKISKADIIVGISFDENYDLFMLETCSLTKIRLETPILTDEYIEEYFNSKQTR